MSAVSDRRTEDGADVRARIDQFLAEHGLTGARVLPLTGDASDRRYYRVMLGDDGTIVSDKCLVGAENRLEHGIRLWPGAELQDHAISF